MSERRAAAFGLFLVACFVGLWIVYQPPAPPAIPAAVTKTIDSLEETAPAFDSSITTRLAGADRLAEVDRRLERQAAASRREADVQRARADSLAAIAAMSADSGAFWHQAHDARLLETIDLRKGHAIDSMRIDSLKFTRDSLRFAIDSVILPRLDVTNGVVVDLRAAIAKLTTRSWRDYVAAGCGIGIRGADCILGVRVPIGR